MMEEKIARLGNGKEEFRQFLNANIRSFSPVREKTRYYFCKYLYYYLEDKIGQYTQALGKSLPAQEYLAELAVFKGVTQLKRKKRSPRETRDFLMEAGISCREIFDDFNYFYFGYVSLDWLDVLMEYYGNLEDLPALQKKKLAQALRHYYPKMESLGDEEILNWQMKRAKKRKRNWMRSTRWTAQTGAISATAPEKTPCANISKARWIWTGPPSSASFCIFGKSTRLCDSLRVTKERLDEILLECGFSKLMAEHDFDDSFCVI